MNSSPDRQHCSPTQPGLAGESTSSGEHALQRVDSTHKIAADDYYGYIIPVASDHGHINPFKTKHCILQPDTESQVQAIRHATSRHQYSVLEDRSLCAAAARQYSHGITEPHAFWDQYRSLEQPNLQTYRAPPLQIVKLTQNLSTDTMDTPSLKIGYNTSFSRKADAGIPTQAGCPGQLVDVYIVEHFVETMAQRLLIRFSRTASNAFPRSRASPKKREEDAGTLKTTSASENQDSPYVNYTVADGPSGRKKLVLGMHARVLASPDAVKVATKWMKDNVNASPTDKLIDFGPPRLDRLPRDEIVDLYRAALALQMRPFPHRLKQFLKNNGNA